MDTEKQTVTEDKTVSNGSERRRKFILDKCQNFDDDPDLNYLSELTENRPKSNSTSNILFTNDLCLMKEDGESHEKQEDVRSTSRIAPLQNDNSSYHGEVEKCPHIW